MKKSFICAFVSLVVLALVGGCSNEDASNKSLVNSGSVSTEYVGDPNPVLVEDFKQSEVEKQLLENILEKIEGTTFEVEGLSGH